MCVKGTSPLYIANQPTHFPTGEEKNRRENTTKRNVHVAVHDFSSRPLSQIIRPITNCLRNRACNYPRLIERRQCETWSHFEHDSPSFTPTDSPVFVHFIICELISRRNIFFLTGGEKKNHEERIRSNLGKAGAARFRSSFFPFFARDNRNRICNPFLFSRIEKVPAGETRVTIGRMRRKAGLGWRVDSKFYSMQRDQINPKEKRAWSPNIAQGWKRCERNEQVATRSSCKWKIIETIGGEIWEISFASNNSRRDSRILFLLRIKKKLKTYFE